MTHRQVYEFEGFRLDTHTQTLQTPADGGSVSLKPKEFDTLLYFVEHAGELIGKETLMQALWPNLVVEENNLNQYITALRKILGEEKGGRRFIMNVRARGYKFVPEVLGIDADAPLTLKHRNKPQPPTQNMSAWQCYQQAVYLQNADHPERWVEAQQVFEQAIALDPDFAAAYALLSLTRVRLYMLDYPGAAANLRNARQEAEKAVSLRPSMADGYMALGAINAASGQWVQAELNYLSARQLDSEWLKPQNMHSANVLITVGHIQRALEIGRQSLTDVKGNTALVTLHATTAALADLDEESQQAITLAKAMGAQVNFSPTCDVLSILSQRQEDYPQAEAAILSALSPYLQQMGSSETVHRVFNALQDESLAEDAVTAIQSLTTRVKFSGLPQSTRRQILLWYTELGAIDAAFEFANKVLDHYEQMNTVGTAWGSLWLREMKPFRDDQRFRDFAARLKLPDYWKAFGPPDNYPW